MYIEVPQVSKCCCKISLKVGSFIVALLNIVLGVVTIGTAILNLNSDKHTVFANDFAAFYHYIGLIFILLIGVCLLITSSMLVTALIKEKHNYILPFFLVEILMFLMTVTGFITFFLKMFSNPSPNAFYTMILLLTGGGCFYCFIVVYSYYREATWSSTIT
ncbi:uncharacterized protein LOC128987792 [Macrosteles quadrilineatus]|uniref:uncharacterized protein LOC128987792 n=1 Tax=Macrosteles quadrilineatus TaxID=74068 RepID=UPI0023E23774|nr:uncharacterized protein LOC128987792 [Macrosteles quadrilineatus]